MDRAAEITLLFDNFSAESKNLYETFESLGTSFNAVSIDDDGFLPNGVISTYGYFLGDFSKAACDKGKPLYFNDVQIPDFWRIESTNQSGKVYDKNKLRANIFYKQPSNKRLVKVVDWLDERGFARLSEHYNKYGAIFCRTYFNKSGQKAMNLYFDADGREVITENFVTGDILLRWQGRDRIFTTKTQFITFFLECSGFSKSAIFYNSLSFPFFASESLPQNGFRDVLFWNEPVTDDIPGNMQIILNNNSKRTKLILVQRKSAYDKLIKLGASPEIVKELGYIYKFVRENGHRKDVLICTNSDNVAHLDDIAGLVPDIHFHVAAITEMSSKLMAIGQHENVSLYPNIKDKVLDSLFKKCDIYLDINYANEIVDALHRAFLNNMLISGFEETLHNASYTADTNTFLAEEYKELAEALNAIAKFPNLIDDALKMQHQAALCAAVEQYWGVLSKLD